MQFLAVGIDPFESPEVIRQYQERNGFPWMMAPFGREMLLAYGVRVQSTKFAMDESGTITYKRGYGTGSADDWLEVLEGLAPGAG